MKYLNYYKLFENILSLDHISDCFCDLYDIGFNKVEDITYKERNRLYKVGIKMLPEKAFKLLMDSNIEGISGRISDTFTKDEIHSPITTYTDGGRRKLNEYENNISEILIDSINKIHNLYLSRYKNGDYVIGFNNSVFEGHNAFIIIRFY